MKLRFAPSPTGYLHIGNVRTALVNWLFTRHHGGTFLLRIDDTDMERSRPEYVTAIEEDMRWLGLEWDETVAQSSRLAEYDAAKQKLIDSGRLYPCYETKEELDIKRKFQLSAGKPPLYDRAALKLTDAEKQAYEAEGRIPHWRFKLEDSDIIWKDLVRGDVKFTGTSMSDPILLREDGMPTYTLSSVVDDGELGITHILRGEDHVSNTAVQVQLFEAIFGKGNVPIFGHLALIRSKDGEMSKRDGGYDIRSLRAEGIEASALTSMLARLGTSAPIEAHTSLEPLVKGFDISTFGRAPATYDVDDLHRINAKIISVLEFDDVKPRLETLGVHADKAFWDSVRPNLSKLSDITEWWQTCKETLEPVIDQEDRDFTAQAAELLPTGEWDNQTWNVWLNQVKEASGRKGKTLFMPIRKALTAREHGPELGDTLPLIGRERAYKRLKGEAA